MKDAGRIVGRIRQAPDGMYGFYKGPGGAGTSLLEAPVLRDEDLEALKVAIREFV